MLQNKAHSVRQVTEEFKVGASTRMRRRDLKRGQQTGTMSEEAGAVRLTCTWGSPNAGGLLWSSCHDSVVCVIHGNLFIAFAIGKE